MPGENPAPVVTPVATPASPSAPSSGAPATPKSYSEEEYNKLVSERDEAVRTVRNAEMFIETDPDVRERLGLYQKSFTEKKPYQDLVKEWETARQAKKTPEVPAKTPETGLTQEQIRAQIRQEIESSTKPLLELQARQSVKETRDNLLKEYPWATDKDLDTYDQRFTEHCMQKAQEIMKANYPRMNMDQAFQEAVNAYRDTPDEMLFNHFMKPEISESILGKRRLAPKLPEGMVDGISTGKDQDVLVKAKNAYKAIEGNAEAVAKLVSEYAPQMGVDPNDRVGMRKLYSLI